MVADRARPSLCRTWVGAGVIGAALALSLSGCGEGGGPTELNEATTVLTKKQVQTALLTASDLGRGFVRDNDDDDDNSIKDAGCIATLDDEDEGPDPAVESEVDYKRSGDYPFPFVNTSVASFTTEQEMAASIQAMADSLEKCDKLEFKADGMTMTIKLTSDNVPSTKKVDEQINVRGVGSMTVTVKKVKRKVPLGLWMSISKVGNQGVSVMLMDINPDSARLLNKYTVKAVERLDDVVNGKDLDKKKPAKPKSTDDAKAKSNA